jgi:PBP1b-binding outer membrane lipoprotein LpoB
MKLWMISTFALLFIVGCGSQPAPAPVVKTVKETNTTTAYVPQKTHKKIALKEVQDDNFSSEYMYPETKVKKEKPVKIANVDTNKLSSATSDGTMDRVTCISMIGQEKFDKYTQMFGSEAASIKRCKMLKAI